MTAALPLPARSKLHVAPGRQARELTVGQEIFPGRLGLSIEEFADAVGIGRTSAYLAVQRGEIPTRRIGRRLIVPLAALETWLSEHDTPGVA